MYWSYFWALCALCFYYEIFSGFVWLEKDCRLCYDCPSCLLIKLLHGIFKIANMAKILYENIKRKLTIVSYRFLALTIPNLVVLYHTPRPQHWLVSFTIFSQRPFCQAKSWKTQNTVFGYKKWLNFESDRISWSATPILWVVSAVVSFTTFSRNDFWNKLGFPCFAALFGAFFVACIRKLKIVKIPF